MITGIRAHHSDRTGIVALLHAQIPIEGLVRRVQLRMPSADEIYPLIHRTEHHTEDIMRPAITAEIVTIIESVDGEELSPAMARAMYEDAEALGAFLDARNRLYEGVAEAGLMYAMCPHCHGWEAVFDIVGLTLALNASPWPLLDRTRMFLALPSLSLPLVEGSRPPGVQCTPQIRFDLPTTRLGAPWPITGGVLGLADGMRELAARAVWEYPFDATPEGREHWTYERPGFRAAVRLCVALRRLEPAAYNERLGDITPGVFTDLAAPDYFFLDNLYYLTHNVDTAADSNAVVSCAACDSPFLPVY